MQINQKEGEKIGITYVESKAQFKLPHSYVSPDGKLLAGVSSITSILNNKPFLVAGSTKENGKYMNENGDPSKTYSQEEKDKMLLEAKNAYIGKSDEAKDIGKLVHELIEQHIKGQEPLMIPDEAKNSYNSFLDFENAHHVVWLLSEEVIYSQKYEFCGTLDGYALIDDKFTLVDFKTSNQVDEGYYLQTGAYTLALQEQMPSIRVEQRLILRIPKDGSDVEPVLVPTDLNFDIETFLHLRECRRWLTNITENHSYVDPKTKFNKLMYKKLNK